MTGRSWRALAEGVGLSRARGGAAPVAWDALLVAVLFAVGAFAVRHDPHDRTWHLALQAGLCLPLLWRRRAPLTVFGAVVAVAFVQWLWAVPLPADVALLVALYTVAARSTRGRVLLAGAVVEAGVWMAAVRWSSEGRYLGSVVGLTSMATAAALVGANMRTRRAHLAALEDRAVRLEREREQRDQLAVARERARIAREMHDIVSHSLSVMVALADAAVFAQSRTPDKAAVAMRQISGTGRQALTDMRGFLGILRAGEPEALRRPVPDLARLEALVGQVRATGLPAGLRMEGDPSAVPTAAQLTVYRLVQEALTNTLKHAPPGTRADVRVRCSATEVAVDVTDDGHGHAARTDGAGHGIPGMRERVAAYGGTVEAGPLPGAGWRVSARLDLGAARNGATATRDGAR